jgi:nicotinamidase-related amidase
MRNQLPGLLRERSPAVLLILDMISDFDFPDGAAVARAARRIAPAIARLKARAAARLILTGVSSQQCVLFTATDAHVRNYEVAVPSDCIAGPSPRDTRFALRYFAEVVGAKVAPAGRLALPRLNRGP